ncbi:MAG: (2Fe-2S) ferredoxin domain-containing protein [Phycisphaerae bacterium]
MPKFERHIFVCTNSREPGHPRGCCQSRGGEQVRDAFKSELKKRGLSARVRANQSGCLDQCEHGATVVIYPDAVWYGFVTPADVPEIIDSHLLGGRPVERLVLPESCLNVPRCPHRPAKA